MLRVLPLSAISLTIFILAGCSSPEPVSVAPRPVVTIIAKEAAAEATRNFPGVVSAVEQVELSFEVSGKVNALPIKRGDELQPNQVVASIEDDDYKLARNSAQADLDAAQAKLTEARTSYQRLAGLLSENAIAQQEVDKAKAILDQSEAAFNNSRARLEQAERNLTNTVLVAPYAGIVAEKHIDNFAQIQAKEPIITLQNLDLLHITVDVPESFVLAVNPNETQKEDVRGVVTFLDQNHSTYIAQFVEFSTAPDPQTKTYDMKFELQTPTDIIILPGMSAEVQLTGFGRGIANSGVRLPPSAITNAGAGEAIVWVVDDQNRVQQRPVTLAESSNDTIRVTNGIKQGERVVVAGVADMRDGLEVRILSQSKR